MRYFVYFSYDGSNYHGWQRQPNGSSVQQTMEEAFSTILSCPTALTGAGRTDTGVHAAMMVAHFDAAADYDTAQLDRLALRLNSFMPADIAIQRIVKVQDTAHARFDAISRTYQYHVVDHKDVFLNRYATRVRPDLDYNLMNQAAALLTQTHDFASFCKLHTDVKTTLCNVSYARWSQLEPGHYVFTIKADRFLRNMVRAIVGTLLDVGTHKMSIEQFGNIIERHHRTAAGQSAPAQGLLLTDIQYPEEIFA